MKMDAPTARSVYRSLRNHQYKAHLLLPWWRYTKSPDYDERVPSPILNYNQNPPWKLSTYIREFKEDASLRELPMLLDLSKKGKATRIFDYGCGLGRLAYAASCYLGEEGRYVGYEVHAGARTFLQHAYRKYDNLEFIGDDLKAEDNYVEVLQARKKTGGIAAEDISFPERFHDVFDVQFSHSVFTHMWKPAIVAVLKAISPLMRPDGVCANTWFVVDEFAQYTLDCGTADRALPYEVNGALTTTLRNPLIDTAYRLADVEEMYRMAGHDVIDIRYGSWSGRDNGTTYQDVVISKPKR